MSSSTRLEGKKQLHLIHDIQIGDFQKILQTSSEKVGKTPFSLYNVIYEKKKQEIIWYLTSNYLVIDKYLLGN